MLKIKRNILFVPDKERDKNDAKLRCRVRWNCNTIAFNLGYRVNIDKWSYETQRCKSNSTHGKKHITAFEINRTIQFYHDNINDIFTKYESNNIVPSVDEFRKQFNLSIGKETKTDNFLLSDYLYTFLKENKIESNTKLVFNAVFKKIFAYKENTKISDINDEYIEGFVSFLQENRILNSTTKSYIEHIKWFLSWCKRKGLTTNTISMPKLKGIDAYSRDVVHLTIDELMTLYNAKLKSITQRTVRDMFCFCCFTGLRFSDLMKLKKTDIVNNTLHVVTKKTIDSIKIELNDFSLEIYNRYKDTDGELLFVKISLFFYNDTLKRICKNIGINSQQKILHFIGNERIEKNVPKYEIISSHCARRTFVVNALTIGIPAEVITRWTGHADLSSMRPYMKIVDELKKAEMAKFSFNNPHFSPRKN